MASIVTSAPFRSALSLFTVEIRSSSLSHYGYDAKLYGHMPPPGGACGR
jgi:hypothetical protein